MWSSRGRVAQEGLEPATLRLGRGYLGVALFPPGSLSGHSSACLAARREPFPPAPICLDRDTTMMVLDASHTSQLTLSRARIHLASQRLTSDLRANTLTHI